MCGQYLTEAEEERCGLVFEAYVMGAETPSVIVTVKGVLKRQYTPDEGIVEPVKEVGQYSVLSL